MYILKNSCKKNFVTVSNEFINDPNLSLSAIGLGVILLSRPSDWIINLSQLQNELKIGRDRLFKIITELEYNNYIYKKYKEQTTFTKKGEQKKFYYISDSKDLLFTEIISKDISSSCSQLPLLDIGSGITEFPCTETSYTEITRHTNKVNTNKIETNKETKLTLHKTLDSLVDATTKHNLLNINPKLTLDEFLTLYDKVSLEVKHGYSKNLNACIILAAQGRWIFRYKEKIHASKTETNINRIIESSSSYFLDLFQNSSFSKDEILKLFLDQCKNYEKEYVTPYYMRLKEKLESN